MAQAAKEKLLFQALTHRAPEIRSLAELPQKVIEKIHYTWLKSIFLDIPRSSYPLFFSILSEKQALGISKQLNEPLQLVPLAPLAQRFFMSTLYKKLDLSQIVPESLLPKSEFLDLASWDKKQLVELIDLLGLYDLATELRTIVDNRILKEIYKALSPKKQAYLKTCLMQKERIVSQKMNVASYLGNSKKLLIALHRRGLMRLGKALSHENSYLLWHLSRTLDKDRGEFLLKCASTNKTPPQIIRYLQKQTKDGIQFLQKNR